MQRENKLTVNVPPLFGDLLLDAVVHRGHRGHWWWRRWRHVGFAGDHWGLPGRDDGSLGWNVRLACGRDDPPRRQRGFGDGGSGGGGCGGCGRPDC